MRRGGHHALGRVVTREADDARRTPDVLDAAEDVQLLGAQIIGRENLVAFGRGLAGRSVHEGAQFGIAARARRAVDQMLSDTGVRSLAMTRGHVAVEQAIVVWVPGAEHYALPPSRTRSLRAARKR